MPKIFPELNEMKIDVILYPTLDYYLGLQEEKSDWNELLLMDTERLFDDDAYDVVKALSKMTAKKGSNNIVGLLTRIEIKKPGYSIFSVQSKNALDAHDDSIILELVSYSSPIIHDQIVRFWKTFVKNPKLQRLVTRAMERLKP